MDLYLGNLPKQFGVANLYHLFSGIGMTADCRIVERVIWGHLERYGYASMSSNMKAAQAIKLLDGKVVYGQPLIVKLFVHRSCTNERRELDWRSKPWDGVERRKQERRGKGIRTYCTMY